MKLRKIFVVFFALIVICAGLWFWGTRNPEGVSVLELGTAAGQSYAYGYPLVLMDVTREAMFEAQEQENRKKGLPPGQAANQLTHVRTLPNANFRAVVRPNLDTLNSKAWLDLSRGPFVLEVPDMGERYYLLPFMDAWTNVFADPGKRTTGPGPARYLIAGPDWERDGDAYGEMPVYRSPTNMVWFIGRIQTDGVADYANIHAFQDGITLTPLQEYESGASTGSESDMHVSIAETADVAVRPSHEVAAMGSREFFERLALLMTANPPAPEDGPVLEQLRLVGVAPGEPQDLQEFGFIARMAVNQGVKMARDMLDEAISEGGEATREGWGASVEDTFSVMGSLGQIKTREGWSIAVEDIGSYGVNYAFRAGVALIGLGANLPEDSVYYNAAIDVGGNPLNGDQSYIIHFDADRLPPVKAFWSVTLYDAEGFLVDNPISRYALTDRDPLQFNEDGSLTFYIQAENPGGELESNWLPAPPSETFNLTARLYWPHEEVLSGEWFMPGVRLNQLQQ